MMCYKDKTFCPFYKECNKGNICEIALTPEIVKEAELWWGSKEAPICVYTDKPECYNVELTVVE